MRKCAQPRTMLPWSVESNRAHLPAIWMAFTSVIKLSSFCTCCSFLSFTVVSHSKGKATVKRTERKGETFKDMFPPTAGNFNKIENVLFDHSQGQSYCVGNFYVSLVAFPNSILFAAI